jgi:hypothetical protein
MVASGGRDVKAPGIYLGPDAIPFGQVALSNSATAFKVGRTAEGCTASPETEHLAS